MATKEQLQVLSDSDLITFVRSNFDVRLDELRSRKTQLELEKQQFSVQIENNKNVTDNEKEIERRLTVFLR